tara:strand:- start:489 stop:614 length:126 start_codon:yes stop_codon:yes gene_type:complete
LPTSLTEFLNELWQKRHIKYSGIKKLEARKNVKKNKKIKKN